jgi:hypothetical protein
MYHPDWCRIVTFEFGLVECLFRFLLKYLLVFMFQPEPKYTLTCVSDPIKTYETVLAKRSTVAIDNVITGFSLATDTI